MPGLPCSLTSWADRYILSSPAANAFKNLPKGILMVLPRPKDSVLLPRTSTFTSAEAACHRITRWSIHVGKGLSIEKRCVNPPLHLLSNRN